MSRRKNRRAARAVPSTTTQRPTRAGFASPGLLPLGAMAAGFGLLPLQVFAQAAPPTAPAASAAAASAPVPAGATLAPIAVQRQGRDRPELGARDDDDDRPRRHPGPARHAAVGHRRHREADRRPPRRHAEGGAALDRRHHLPGGRGRRGRHPPARLLARRERRHLRRRRARSGVLRPRHLQLRPRRAAARLGVDAVRARLDRRRRQPGAASSRSWPTSNEVQTVGGTGSYFRVTGDFNLQTWRASAVRLNAMTTYADNDGNTIDKHGVAPTFRWGIGTADEFSVGCYYLNNDNGINYGLPWLRPNSSGPTSVTNPSGLVEGRPEELLRRRERLQRRRRRLRHGSAGRIASPTAASCTRSLRHGRYDRDQRASTIRFCYSRQQQRQPRLPGRRAVARHGQRRDRRSRAAPTTRCRTDGHLPAERLQQQLQPGSAARNEVLAGVDLAHEEFNNYTLVAAARRRRSNKNDPRTTSARRTTARLGRRSAAHPDAQPRLRRQGARRLCPGPGPGRAELEDARRRCAGTSFKGDYQTSRPRRRRPFAEHHATAPLRLALERALRRALPAERPAVVPRLVRHLVQHLGRHLPVRRARARTRRRRRAETSSSAPSSTCSRASSRARAGDLPHHQVQRAQPRLARRRAARRLPAVGQAPRRRPRHRPRRPHHAAVGGLRARTPGSRSPRSTRARRGVDADAASSVGAAAVADAAHSGTSGPPTR